MARAEETVWTLRDGLVLDNLPRSIIVPADSDTTHHSSAFEEDNEDSSERKYLPKFPYHPQKSEHDDDDHDEDDDEHDDPLNDRQETSQDRHDPHAYVGLSIIFGFILMY